MNTIRKLSTVLLLSSLALSAGPAGAVSPNSIWFATQFNGGKATIPMVTSAGHFCYLRSVGFENTDTNGETATCRVTRGAVVWVLEAVLNENNDADAFCSAYCYNN
ncbi:MAG: hypothetical protein ACREYF_27590 [Gammaproteobacteria bacterium]